LPIGLQLVGRWHDEAFLLDVAERFEMAFAEGIARHSLKSKFQSQASPGA
jgi:Asp-tRNA(Asn)/Glu-tRNA(Gln) amidotransferase A subunit family amidase